MKQQKKGKFFTFIFSFLPGAAEMYMGFMKQGVSLMALFLLSLVGPLATRGMEMLAMVAIIIWFYGFFHARNLAAMPEEEFMELPDEFIWQGFLEERNFSVSNPTLRKWGAGILIVFGAVLLWENFSQMIYNLIPEYLWDELYPIVNRVPQVVVAVMIIWIGIKLMAGKKEELHGDER